jgi:hypothetical protein
MTADAAGIPARVFRLSQRRDFYVPRFLKEVAEL